MKRILFAVVLIVFIGVPVEVSGQTSEVAQSSIAQSFASYFSPQIFRAVDNMMKVRFTCQSDVYWKIWTYGFYRNYKGADGKKFEVVLNWDGNFYVKSNSELIATGDWTTLK